MARPATTAEKERILCYAAGILSSKLSNPNNVYTAEGLMHSCIKEAAQLIDNIFDDSKLMEILK